MLVKERWRFIQNHGSLVCQLFKAIYFPMAKVSEKPSYAWRILLHGRDVLHARIQQQIGDGTSTNVWTDLWLPQVDLSSFQSSHITLVLELLSQQGQ